MNNPMKMMSAVLAAVMIGQTVVAQEAPQSAVTPAERAQEKSQQRIEASFQRNLDEINKSSAEIQSFIKTLGSAKAAEGGYVMELKQDDIWLEHASFVGGWGMVGAFMFKIPKGVSGYKEAKTINLLLRTLRSFRWPGAVLLTIGVGVAIWVTIDEVKSARRLKVSEAEMLKAQTQIENAKMVLNMKVQAAEAVASRYESKITEHDGHYSIEGLSNVKNITGGFPQVLQLQTQDNN